jgi:4,5-DOPA dioxygenase extradiol
MTTATRAPVLFIGHGSPMNALGGNDWSRSLTRLGGMLGPLRAIIAISAHWYLPARRIGSAPRPATVHDFGGFPPELFQLEYPVAGDPQLARRLVAMLGGDAVLDPAQGLDHGIWSVLLHLIPDHRLPVVPLSIDSRCTPEQHIACGRSLASLREEGVLLLCTGNVTHNLGHAMQAMRSGATATPEWASRFDAAIAAAASARDAQAVARLLGTPDGRMAHPSPDHLLPLLYALGACDAQDAVSFPTSGYELGSLSMRSIRCG